MVDNSIINSDNIATEAFIGNKDFIKKLQVLWNKRKKFKRWGAKESRLY